MRDDVCVWGGGAECAEEILCMREDVCVGVRMSGGNSVYERGCMCDTSVCRRHI